MSAAKTPIRWRRGTVRVDDGAEGFHEPAVICRGLAVHALPSRGVGHYRVTHVASGRMIGPVFETRPAVLAWARRLLALGDWTGSAEMIKRRFGPDVRRLRAARAAEGLT